MSDPVEFLDLDDVIELARRLLGDPPPIRDIGLLGSAVARPQTTVGAEDAYPTVWSKAAALLQSIVANHALVDGNKRLGWLATAVLLEINGASVATAANDDVVDLVMAVAASEVDHRQVARKLEQLREPRGSDTGAAVRALWARAEAAPQSARPRARLWGILGGSRQRSSPAHVTDGIVGDDRAAVVWAIFSVQTAAGKLVTERMSRGEAPPVTDELLVAIRAEWEAAGRPIVRPHAHRDQVMFADGTTVVGVRFLVDDPYRARRPRADVRALPRSVLGTAVGPLRVSRGSTSACPMPPNCASHSRTCWTAHAAANTSRSVASEGTDAPAPLWRASRC